jgi:general stress protein YciG
LETASTIFYSNNFYSQTIFKNRRKQIMANRRDYDDDDDRGRRSSGRGFAGMDREEQREISRMGGRASNGGRREEDYDDDDRGYRSRSRGYNDDERGERRDNGRGFASMDREEQREIARMGGRASGGRRFEEEDYDRGSRSRSRDYDDEREEGTGRNGGRGFASMDREEQREIAHMGRRASHGGRRYEEDSDGRSSRSRSRDYDDGGNGHSSDRGRGWFGDREGHAEAAERGWEERGRSNRSRRDDEGDDRYESRRGSRTNRSSDRGEGRGFASMDPEEIREIASMGGRAAHEAGTAHEWSSSEARRAARSRWED